MTRNIMEKSVWYGIGTYEKHDSSKFLFFLDEDKQNGTPPVEFQ